MSESLAISSHTGTYHADFIDGSLAALSEYVPERAHFVIDRRVWELYETELTPIVGAHPKLLVEALETNKSLEKTPEFITTLAEDGLKRGVTLVGVGGGIIEDITCFIASIVYRGLPWVFIPTTLLAQADSCIGSKSSINSGHIKNVVGTFYPPTRVPVHAAFRATLGEQEIESGIGEMLKVAMLDGRATFEALARDYPRLKSEPALLTEHIRRSLTIKKRFIEADEFDKGIRNLLNYGHSFGHAIEASTDFGAPHGIAVTIGMDAANFYASESGRITRADFESAHSVLFENYKRFADLKVPVDGFLQAITRDKKNVSQKLALILPGGADLKIDKVFVEPDERFQAICRTYFAERMRS